MDIWVVTRQFGGFEHHDRMLLGVFDAEEKARRFVEEHPDVAPHVRQPQSIGNRTTGRWVECGEWVALYIPRDKESLREGGWDSGLCGTDAFEITPLALNLGSIEGS